MPRIPRFGAFFGGPYAISGCGWPRCQNHWLRQVAPTAIENAPGPYPFQMSPVNSASANSCVTTLSPHFGDTTYEAAAELTLPCPKMFIGTQFGIASGPTGLGIGTRSRGLPLPSESSPCAAGTRTFATDACNCAGVGLYRCTLQTICPVPRSALETRSMT